METKRHIALPDDLWTATKAQALLESVGARDIVIAALVDYLDRASKPPEYVVNKEAGVTTVHYPLQANAETDCTIAEEAEATAPRHLDRVYDPHFGFARPAPKPLRKAR